MTEKDNFLMPDHIRLLNIAVWANVLAWLVLAVYILAAGVEVLRFQQDFLLSQSINIATTTDYIVLISRAAVSMFRGLVSFVALRAISLGLIVIVETSINSSEQKEGDHE